MAEPIAQIDASGTIVYIHTDHLATPRLATDGSQAVVWRWTSRAFGEGEPNEDVDGDGSAVVINHRFPGQHFDGEAGLYYNYFRDYDPALGRYIKVIRLGLRAE